MSDSGMKTVPLSEWKAEAVRRFGEDRNGWAFRCPRCGETQTYQDFVDAGIEEPDNKVYFSCIGRWVKGRGCDWTLGGLFQIHKTEVLTEEGDSVPVFEFAEQ